MTFPIVIISIFWMVNIYFRIRFSLHMMQIEMYDNEKFINWSKKNRKRFLTQKSRIMIGISALLTIVYILWPYNIYILVAIWSVASITTLEFSRYEAKKPLVYTGRAKRLFAATILIAVIDIAVIVLVSWLISGDKYFVAVCSTILALALYFGTYYVVGGAWVIKPVEKIINMKYYKMAGNKIKNMEKLTTIGITGSYGKTSTKFITAKIIEQRYKTYKTPGSFNTPMGISKAVNNELDENYNVFVAELGADRIGDIKETARLVSPKIGILTSIGPSHLETFKSIENIVKTKYELIEELPYDGWAIFNYDNEYVKKLADKTYTRKLLYGLNNTGDLDIYADNIKTGREGSTFTLHIKEKGTVECKTSLLGKHNIRNILAGVCAAYALDMTLVQIASGIEKIEPIEHRLQLIDPGTGVLVIDDAFNSNPAGAAAALEVLSEFEGNRKIIVTPGMVELGRIEYEENRKFGVKIGETCDLVILVGENRTRAIREGIEETDFEMHNLVTVKSLKESEDAMKSLLRAGDVVLFENDLPDTYNE